jgi:hypothetical protein
MPTKRIISQELVADSCLAVREVLTANDPTSPVTTPIQVKELPTAIRSIPHGMYGVRKVRSVNNTALTRIGSEYLHRTLPIHEKMMRCVVNDDGTVNYWLHPTDSRFKMNGELAKLDGTDGQIMVRIPRHYYKDDIYTDSVTGYVNEDSCVSMFNLPGYKLFREQFYSFAEAVLDRTLNKLACVMNTTARYRGGNNTSGWDNTYRSLLGMPATNINLTTFRTYAANRGTGWTAHNNNIYEAICRLYKIEYASTDIQLAFTSTLTAEGYHQGGLGSGVTNMPDWNSYNGYNPIVPCGVTLSLGNSTGVVNYAVKNSAGTTVYTAPVPSYRGIENFFGHVWKHTDGLLVEIQSAAAGDLSKVYKCEDHTKFSSTITADYEYIGNEARSEGWTKNVLTPTMVASEVGANSSTGWADYHYTNIPSSGSAVRCVLFGGAADYGAGAGFASANSYYAPSYAFAIVGSRLCFTPADTEATEPEETT